MSEGSLFRSVAILVHTVTASPKEAEFVKDKFCFCSFSQRQNFSFYLHPFLMYKKPG